MNKGNDDFAGGEELPESFEPSKYDVIVGWARQNYHHEGNQMLRNIVRDNVPRYMAAKTKHDKGIIIVEILETIRAKSPSGHGLIRQNTLTKRWYYIGTDKAKDKIGHALRKASRDLQRGVKGSPIKQQRRGSKTNCKEEVKSNLFPPSSESRISQSSLAIKSYQSNNPATIAPRVLEPWPLRSVTSLSSSESQSEELHHQHHHDHGAIQVTVPSSPVARPGSSASNSHPATEAAERYAREFFDDKHHASWPASQGHHYDGHPGYYHRPSNNYHYHGHDEYRRRGDYHYYHHPVASNDAPCSQEYSRHPHHAYGVHQHQHPHEYQESAAPSSTPSSGNFHRIFDEVEVPHHPHNNHDAPHEQRPYPEAHPSSAQTSHHAEMQQYHRSVSHEGPLIH